uniref:Uncharacterized protein n=1 Tax=Cacopsylla melanoneura TaxID=428564 RepID=A0A8D9BCG0_9HEMI
MFKPKTPQKTGSLGSEGRVEPFDLSQFFQDVDNGKYGKFRRDPSESESINQNSLSNANLTFPDFFDAAATDTFEEIVEKETDQHVGPAMTRDFERLLEDVDFDINMQEHRRRNARSADIQNATLMNQKTVGRTINAAGNLTVRDMPTGLRKLLQRKQKDHIKTRSNQEPLNNTDIKESGTESEPKISDIIIEKSLESNKTLEFSEQKDEEKKLTNNDNGKKEYVLVMDKLKKEMKDKIQKSNEDLMKKINESNINIQNEIMKIKEKHNISHVPDRDFMAHVANMFNSSDSGMNNNMSMLGGDSILYPKIVPLNLNNNSSKELIDEALNEFSEEKREKPRKRYASDAYFPEIEDYPNYGANYDDSPSYDDEERSSPASEERPKSRIYDEPAESPKESPYNPSNIPPSSSFSHMYRTFDNEAPLSTHYSTNHDPNHSSRESSNYNSGPSTFEPFSNFNYDPPPYRSHASNSKKENSEPNRMVEVDGDAPDMEYQRVSEPSKEHDETGQNDFDIDKFISDFNTDPPYSVDREQKSDEGDGEEEEEGGDEGEEGEDETEEGESEVKPREYRYKKTVYGGSPKESNFEKGYENIRSSNFRPRSTVKSSALSSLGPKSFKNLYDDASGSKEKTKINTHRENVGNGNKSKPSKRCVKSTKTVPGSKKKMKCKLCENLKTGGKSEHCSYLVNPNKDNYVVGTEEVTYRTINHARRKRDIKKLPTTQSKALNTLSKVTNYPGIEYHTRMLIRNKRDDDYDEADDDEEEEDENIEAEYGPEYDPYFGEPVGYKSSDGGSCRTVYDDDGAECRVCRNKKTNGEFKECSYASKPEKQAYEFGTSKVYGSGKLPRFKRNQPRYRRNEESKPPSKERKYKRKKVNKYDEGDSKGDRATANTDTTPNRSSSEEVSKLRSELLGGISKGENVAKEQISSEAIESNMNKKANDLGNTQRKFIGEITDSMRHSNEGGEYVPSWHSRQKESSQNKYRKGEDFADELPAETSFGGERKSDFYNDHFSQSFPELLENGRESLEVPSLRASSSFMNNDKTSFSNGRKGFSNSGLLNSRSLLEGDGFESKGSRSLLGDDGFNTKSSRGLLDGDGFRSRGSLLDDKDFFRNNKMKLGTRFEGTKSDAHDLFNDRDSDNLNRMFGEFAAKDRSNCKKRYKDKMTCYACVDENNIRQEECIYIKNGEPETKQVAYHETNQYNNPKAQSSEGRESRVYSSPTHEPFEQEEDEQYVHEPEPLPKYKKAKKSSFKKRPQFDNERTSNELEFDIKKKYPKFQKSFSIGNSNEEAEAVEKMDIQRVTGGKSKPQERRREQSYSESSHIENIEVPDDNEELSDASVSEHFNKNKETNSSSSHANIANESNFSKQINPTPSEIHSDGQVEGSHVSESVDTMDEEPEEPETEGPEGAFSDETEVVYDPERKLELPKYMVEKSEGEKIFDKISGMS